ncbi:MULTISPECIES: 4'-phosphopantetheinyl transferase superfamily protein [unclassified Rhizobium]|uniref:4'-phosphopantetheinyl transferase family protein n=1 Tax=unclassified Rhizobium TaxID=2613769 RepID=UPI00247A924C|nr:MULTISPECIES: 4'-phosphopantetheinyl transferase superfamily protein [unclassified Rhizobium]MDH7803857.1 phosphopantetheinyl transferase [Rhizobium sp. AN70]
MTEVVWHSGYLDLPADPGDAPVVWYVRLDDADTEKTAHSATLSRADLEDLAQRPEAGMRGIRRRLLKVLLARLSGLHPDEIIVGRTEPGAPRILHPAGWNISVAGRWPHCLIGVSRSPIGVDIEPLDAEPPAEDSFTPAEAIELQGASSAALLARWVAKEAHAKCLGIASRIDAAEIETRTARDRLDVVSGFGTTASIVRVHDNTVQAFAFL